MRIIAGALKGRRLDAPTWAGLRPTSDKLRETLFNVLQGRLPGARVLDAYAGTGAVGVEALSRGAAQVTFVERDPRAKALIAAIDLIGEHIPEGSLTSAREKIVAALGEEGKHARAAVGMASLPLGGCIEVAMTAEVAPS